MNLDKHTREHKKYVNALKAMNELYDKIRQLPWRELDEPYQDGWKLSPSLRADFTHQYRDVVEELIHKYGVPFITKKAKAITAIRRKPCTTDARTVLFHKKYMHAMDALTIKPIGKKEYEALSVQQKKFFVIVDHVRSSNGWQPRYEITIRPHYLITKIEKRMITRIQDIDGLLLQELDELNRILEPYWRKKGGYEWDEHYFKNRSDRRKIHMELSKFESETV